MSKEKIEVTGITIEFTDGTEMNLPIEQARQLHSALNELFKPDSGWSPLYHNPTDPWQDHFYCGYSTADLQYLNDWAARSQLEVESDGVTNDT